MATQKCPYCGYFNSEGTEICIACKKNVNEYQPSQQATIFCRQCGTPITGGGEFCPSCGTKQVLPDSQAAYQPPQQPYMQAQGGYYASPQPQAPYATTGVFKNIGGKLKTLAAIVEILGILGSIIAGIVSGVAVGKYDGGTGFGVFLLYAIGGSLISIIASWYAYAIGENNTLLRRFTDEQAQNRKQ
jgi:RNA polymerase subunit RPABC4/transcription elongation factor Spt4